MVADTLVIVPLVTMSPPQLLLLNLKRWGAVPVIRFTQPRRCIERSRTSPYSCQRCRTRKPAVSGWTRCSVPSGESGYAAVTTEPPPVNHPDPLLNPLEYNRRLVCPWFAISRHATPPT